MMLFIRKLVTHSLVILIAGMAIFTIACGPAKQPSTPSKTGSGVATKLVFNTQPSGAVAGVAFDPQPVVAVQDAGGNIVTDYNGLIEIAISASTNVNKAKLIGGAKRGLSGGKVEFKSLAVDKTGVGYTLTASCGNLSPAISLPFSVDPGKPSKLAFTLQPSPGIAGQPLTPGPEVTVQDDYGNTVTGFQGSVSVSATVTYEDIGQSQQRIMKTYPMALFGTTTVNATNGVARYTDISCRFARPVGYSLVAVSGSLGSATSAFFSISPAEATKVEFTVPPSGVKAGTPFEEQPKVAIEDTYGNVVLSARGLITVSLTPGSGVAGAILSGTTTRPAEDAFGGLAAFTDLSIDLAGSGYILTAKAEGLTSAQSPAFDVLTPE